MARGEFTVIMRGPSAVRFAPEQNLVCEDFPSDAGPVRITYRTRWFNEGERRIRPGDIWIEVKGTGNDLEKLIVPLANAGLALLPLLSLSANAAIGEPEVEIAFESTPKIASRQYFQQYLLPESSIVHLTRSIDIGATISLLKAISSHVDGERLRRAANQYCLSLQSWRLGREALSLAHLWMAVEALTKAKIREACLRRNARYPRDLANCLGVELKDLDATIRQQLILNDDEECYQKSRTASDGFEHGYLGYDKISSLAKDVRHRMAGYVRNAILDMSGIESTVTTLLQNDPFDKPMGYWPVVKYIRGSLEGTSDDLALEGQLYPFMKWDPTVKTSEIKQDGKLEITFNDTWTAEIGKGISFTLKSFEVWKAE